MAHRGLRGMVHTPEADVRSRRNAQRFASNADSLFSGALTVDDDGYIILTLASNSGLSQSTSGLTIDLDTTPGLVLGAGGIKALVQDVLAIDASGIKVTIGTGLQSDAGTLKTKDSEIIHDDLVDDTPNQHIDWTDTNENLITIGTGTFKNIGIETTATPGDTKANMRMSSNTMRFEGYDASTGGQTIGFEIDFDATLSYGPTLRGTTTKDASHRLYIDGAFILVDNQKLSFGTVPYFEQKWDPTNNDYMIFQIGVGNAAYSGNLVFADRSNLPPENYPIVLNPTFRIQSSSGTFEDFIQFYHDGTDGRIESGSDTLNLGDDALITTGGVTAGASTFGDGGITNYTEVKPDGEINLHGTARVTKTAAFKLYSTGAGLMTINNLWGARFTPTGDSLITCRVYIPNNIVSGSDVVVKFRWCPTVTNLSGSDKYVYWKGTYNAVGKSGVIGSATTVDPFSTTVPDTEVANTIHETTWETISGLSAGDFLCIALYRDGNHASDDYPEDVMLFIDPFIEYTADKLGTAT